MGGPSAAIVAEELIGLGARRLVRVGTCGALADGPRLGDLLVAGEALCEDGASRALGAGERAAADPELTAALERAAGRSRCSSPPPTSSTTPTPSAPGRWAAAGAVAVEMEAATLFTVARLRGVARGLRPDRLRPRRRDGARIGDDGADARPSCARRGGRWGASRVSLIRVQ